MAKGKLPYPAVARGTETTGRVAQLSRGRLCGVIRARDGQSVFFHRGDLVGIKYNDIKLGAFVRFELVADSISGPRAVRVRLKKAAKRAASRSSTNAQEFDEAAEQSDPQ